MHKSVMIAVGLGMVLALAASRAWAGDAGTSTAPAASANSGPATDSASAPANAAEIAKLIEQLGAETAATRDAAQKAMVKIGLPALPALRQAAGAKNAEIANRAAVAAQQILDSSFQAKLGDATVRLLGVSGRPLESTGCWLPHGEPMDASAVPTDWPKDGSGSDLERVFGFEISGMPGDALPRAEVGYSGTSTGMSSDTRDGVTRRFCLRTTARGIEAVPLDIGVDHGPWFVHAEAAQGETAKDPNGGQVTVSRLETKNNGLTGTCTYQRYQRCPGWRYRLMLIKPDGTAVETHGSSTRITGGTCETEVHFPNEKPQDGLRVRLDRREIAWVRFDNVSVVSGKLSDFKPARRIPAEQVGLTPPLPGVAAVAPASRDKEEAPAAELAERFLLAVQNNDANTAGSLSLGSVSGWLSEDRTPPSPRRLPPGLSQARLVGLVREFQREVKYPGSKPRAGQVAFDGDIAGVPFELAGRQRYLLVLLKRTAQGWRFVTLDGAGGTVPAETAHASGSIRKALAAINPPTSEPAAQPKPASESKEP